MMVTVLYENETDFTPDFSEEEIAKLVCEAVLKEEKFTYPSEVNISVTDNEGIRQVNAEFRKIDKATDVLSFPAYDFENPGKYENLSKEPGFEMNINPDTGNFVLGDILLSYERILSQAEDYGHSVKREFAFLIAHSMLHLLGYDHMSEEEAGVMEAKQEKILNEIGIVRI